MTTPPEDPDSAPDESVPSIAIQTPFGVFTSADDIPPELRSALVDSLDAPGLPAPIRAALVKLLDIDESDIADHADAHTAHQPGCSCAETHREEVWRILDAAYPNDPHLWVAMHELFMISASNPVPIGDQARRESLVKATAHLQQRIRALSPVESPLDELVSKFRDQLGGL